jgi:anti-sigma regulatory factor (Ser/Thr protein kinase)
MGIALIQPSHRRYPIQMPEDVGALRREVQALASQQGASPARAGDAALAATELGNNLIEHARPGGYALVRVLAEAPGIELIAVDAGPGIRDVAAALDKHERDRSVYRAGGPPPEGLGAGIAAVRRLADVFELHCAPSGTVVLGRFFFEAVSTAGAGDVRLGGVSVPLTASNGDGWAVYRSATETAVIVVDGLGHGTEAAQASAAACNVFCEGYDGDALAFAERAHAAMRGTRGGALGLARIVPRERLLQFLGVGNVEGRLLGCEGARGLVSFSGTLGITLAAPTLRVLDYAWAPGSTLILHSDGVRSRFDLSTQIDSPERDPAVIAAVVYRDAGRAGDDATVVVVRDAVVPAPPAGRGDE